MVTGTKERNPTRALKLFRCETARELRGHASLRRGRASTDKAFFASILLADFRARPSPAQRPFARLCIPRVGRHVPGTGGRVSLGRDTSGNGCVRTVRASDLSNAVRRVRAAIKPVPQAAENAASLWTIKSLIQMAAEPLAEAAMLREHLMAAPACTSRRSRHSSPCSRHVRS
jgi:hypothetical protein